MRHIKVFESVDYNQETWISKIKWLHSYYNKVDIIKSTMPKLLDSLEVTFENPKHNQGKSPFYLQLGLSDEYGSTEYFFRDESNLIINPIYDEDIIKQIIHSGFRFNEKIKSLKNDKSTYPYYKLEGYLSIDGNDIYKDVDIRTNRYEKWISSLLSDYFKGWDIRTQIRINVDGASFWIHLIDKTRNLKLENFQLDSSDNFFPKEISQNEYIYRLENSGNQLFDRSECNLFKFDKPYFVEIEKIMCDVTFIKSRKYNNSISYFWYKFKFTKLKDEYFLIQIKQVEHRISRIGFGVDPNDPNNKKVSKTITNYLLADGHSELSHFIEQVNKYGNSRLILFSIDILENI